jgi:hypothetical protein
MGVLTLDESAQRGVNRLLHELSNSLTLISCLGGCLEDLVEPTGLPVVASLERAAVDANDRLNALRRELGLGAPGPAANA